MSKGARKKAVGILERYLRSNHSPRLEMTVVLGLTAVSGFLTSVWLLGHGVDPMALRYPLAAAAGYAVFLVLVWCLVRVYRAGADRALAAEKEFLGRSDSVRLDLPDAPDPSGCLDLPGDEGC